MEQLLNMHLHTGLTYHIIYPFREMCLVNPCDRPFSKPGAMADVTFLVISMIQTPHRRH